MANGLDPIRDLGFKTPIPSVAGQFSGRICIVGSARCVWADISGRPGDWPFSVDWMPIKQMGLYLPFPYRHWAGGHNERWQWYKPLAKGIITKRVKGQTKYIEQCRAMVHAPGEALMVDHVWAGPLGGTSGLFGARVALALGFEEVLLCGIPMDGSGRFYDAPWVNESNLGSMDEWERFAPIFDGRVKSMSGKTREILGGPK